MVEYRSVSQLKEYQRCPHAYYLHRVEGVWERPAAWLPQGLAVHEAAEEYEKSGRTMDLEKAQEVFRESYAKHTNRLLEETPNTDFWFASGPYRGEQDIERRFGLGLGQVEQYINYYTETAPREVIWITPEGEPAIELGFNIDLDGVPVRGFIDQVIEHPDHGVHVRDIKTGNQPGDDFQLSVYAVAINELHGAEVRTGDYWMGRRGKPTASFDLTAVPRNAVADQFNEVDQKIKAGEFDPQPEPSKCRFCSVSGACVFAAP